MKLKEYIEKLQELEKQHGDLEVIYSIDSEGNAFCKIYYEPTAGHYNGDDAEFINLDSEDYENEEVNSVCVN